MSTTPPAFDSLARRLGLLDAVGIGIGAIVGAGIFVVIGVAAGTAGPALLLSLLIAGFAATANALTSAQLAAEYPQSGGTYEYGYRLLSPAAGFAAGWMFLASKIAAAGTVSLGLGAYLEALIPGLHPRLVAVSAILLFTLLNYFGVRRSSRVNLAIVTVSVGSLLVLVATGALTLRREHFVPFAPFGFTGVLEAAALLFFAYTGYARVATLGEEVRDPRRTIPRAITITIVGSMLLYAVVAVVGVGAAGAPRLASTAAPLLEVAKTTGQPWLGTVVAAGGVTAMIGVILSQVLGLSRMAFAMPRRHDLPRFLAGVHPSYGVPHRAVVATGLLAALVAATGTLRGVATAASFTILVYYLIANVAALRMPRDSRLYPRVVPAAGVVMCVVLALSLSFQTIVSGAALLAAGFAVRWMNRLRRVQ